MEVYMSKIQKDVSLREKYSSDKVMSHLIKCNHNIKRINHSLKHNGASGLTLEEIGLILGVTRERVRQIETSALKKLRHPSTGRLLREYLEI